jgi:hypothetical protein
VNGRPRDMRRPPAHPTELTDPCCLPTLGELGEMSPHGGLPMSLGETRGAAQAGHDFTNPAPAGSLSGGGFA